MDKLQIKSIKIVNANRPQTDINGKSPAIVISYISLMIPFAKFGKMLPKSWTKPKCEQYVIIIFSIEW